MLYAISCPGCDEALPFDTRYTGIVEVTEGFMDRHCHAEPQVRPVWWLQAKVVDEAMRVVKEAAGAE